MHRALFGGIAVAATWFLVVGAWAADDHLKCYKIKDPVRLRGTPPAPPPSWLDLTGPEFGSENCKIVGGFRLYCTPVEKTVTAPIERNTGGGYSSFTPMPLAGEVLTQSKICYKIKCPDNAVPNPNDLHPVFDQFGNRAVSKYRPFMLCGPAEEGQLFTTTLSGANEVPPNASAATGSCTAVLEGNDLEISCTHDITMNLTGAHLHNGAPGVTGPIICGFPGVGASPIVHTCAGLSPADLASLALGNLYINIHSSNCGTCPGGEIRGQLELAP